MAKKFGRSEAAEYLAGNLTESADQWNAALLEDRRHDVLQNGRHYQTFRGRWARLKSCPAFWSRLPGMGACFLRTKVYAWR